MPPDDVPAPESWMEPLNEQLEEQFGRRLVFLLDSLPAWIYFRDREGTHLFVNRAFQKSLGIPRREIVGHSLEEVFDPDTAASIRRNDREVLETEGPVKTEEVVTRDGRDRVYLSVKTPVRNDAGEVIGICGFSIEITERVASRRELERDHRELQKKTYRDDLTGVGNRRRLDEQLRRDWVHCGFLGQPLSVLMVDIDHFKQYNDRFGHQDGDACLRRIAETLEEDLHRSADWIARYGGEEFCVVLPDTDEEGARSVAESLRERVEELGIDHPDSPFHGVVTVSVGMETAVPSTESRMEDVIDRADRALYVAKERGRNTIVHGRDIDDAEGGFG